MNGATVVAEVDDHVITVDDMRRGLRRDSTRLICFRFPQDGEAYLRAVEEEVLGELIDDALILAECRRQVRRRFSPAEVAAEVRRLAAAGVGEDDDEVARLRAEEAMMVRHARAEHRLLAPPVSDADVARYDWENRAALFRDAGVHLRLIRLTATRELDLAQQVRTAEAIRERIRDGEDFATLAREFSQDSRSVRGGDWDWVSHRDLRTELADAAWSLTIGETSPPITVDDTDVFLLQVIERRPAGIAPLEEWRSHLRATLATAAADDVERRWIEGLRAKARIRLHPPEE